MKLPEKQALFAQGVTDEASPELLALFTKNDNERFAIYRNNIFGSLIKCLLQNYALVTALVGEEFAKGLFRAYIRENLPTEACVARYGAGMAEFIERFAPAAELPYLPDAARFDWAINEAYHAADDEALQQAQPDLQLRASVRLMESRWPLAALRELSLKQAEGNFDMGQAGGGLLIFRPQLEVQIVPLDTPSYKLLSLLAHNPLEAALQQTLETAPDFDFQAFLQEHLRLGTFACCRQGPSHPVDLALVAA